MTGPSQGSLVTGASPVSSAPPVLDQPLALTGGGAAVLTGLARPTELLTGPSRTAIFAAYAAYAVNAPAPPAMLAALGADGQAALRMRAPRVPGQPQADTRLPVAFVVSPRPSLWPSRTI
jgi:hypothetical protein